MQHGLARGIGLALLGYIVCAMATLADSVFTIEDPPVDFEVVDAEPFDGVGDNGPFPTFNDALVGTEGECRSMAEFDISPFGIPPGEVISAARFEVRITDVDVFGLGVDGETPENLVVDGYIGNGIAELSDFEAGDGRLLDQVATPEPWIGEIVAFDVTAFVSELVDSHESFVGLTVRAGSFGGLMMEERSGFPRLTIETLLPGAVGEDDAPAASLALRIAPNPFTGLTRIEYRIPGANAGPAVLAIHDAAGRLVRTWQKADQGGDTGSLWWDGLDQGGVAVPDGVYFWRVETGSFRAVRRVTLVR